MRENEQTPGTRFIVMEYVEGHTLAEKIPSFLAIEKPAGGRPGSG